MKKILITTIILAAIITGCENNKPGNSSAEIPHYWEIIDIDTKRNGLGLAEEPQLVVLDNQEFYTNYNDITHSLNFYNLKTRNFEKKIDLYKSGPNKVQSVSVHDFKGDTVIIRCTEMVRLFNSSGKLIKELQLKDMCPELENKYALRGRGGAVITNLQRLFIDKEKGNMPLSTYNKQDAYSDIYKDPCFCNYNLNTKRGEVLNVEFPKELYKSSYDLLGRPNIISKGDSIIWNFPFKAVIYIYDKKSKKTTEKRFKAKNIPPVIKGGKLSKKSGHNLDLAFSLFNGDKYHQIDYDKYRDLYYMLYSKKRVDKLPGEEKHLIVFDNKLEKIGEVTVPREMSPKFAISEQGLLFRKVLEDSFDTLKLHVLNVSLK